jgi:hypothetical protein
VRLDDRHPREDDRLVEELDPELDRRADRPEPLGRDEDALGREPWRERPFVLEAVRAAELQSYDGRIGGRAHGPCSGAWCPAIILE